MEDNEELKTLKPTVNDENLNITKLENNTNNNNEIQSNNNKSNNSNSSPNSTPKLNKFSIDKPESFLEKEEVKDIEISFNELYESYIRSIEDKTKLKRKYIYVILGISYSLFLLGYFEIYITYLLTAYFPIIWTYQDYKNKKEDYLKMWGSYWVIFLFFVSADFFYKSFIEYVPFYFVVRTSFLLILYLPCFRGAIAIYHSVFIEFIRLTSKYKGKYNEKYSMLAEYKNRIKAKKE